MMKTLLSVVTMCVSFAVAGCGEAESIDPAEIDAENVRREEARAAEVVDATKERAVNEGVSVRDRDEEAVAAGIARESGALQDGESPDTGASVTPPDSN
jgi:hypothetical protein